MMSELRNRRTAAMQSTARLSERSGNFRRGFTVLELLVASLLLGMLMTILTMIFNQSSIAWRTGLAGVDGMEDARGKVSAIRYKYDNGYEWNGNKYVHGLFDSKGELVASRTGADGYISDQFEYGQSDNTGTPTLGDGKTVTDSYSRSPISCGSGGGNGDGKNYIVNAMSWGPDRSKDDRYDNIYSFFDPDDWDW